MNRWIITNHKFFEHRSLEKAKIEHARLSAKCPKQKFTIQRIKTSLQSSNAPEVIKNLTVALQEIYETDCNLNEGFETSILASKVRAALAAARMNNP